ncbi:ABC transporter permease [Pontibacter sp. SGAir0037]|uniref:ABC transporter permease n=1 Tax=Pontibacter sp. SGAir0037 TaxID=2571030 RepID=UPI0010CCC81A|nr:ABC transporter permease subunit [Pontibacter sp. SGAir0037]QCR20999.1 ABC transporter permease [Pontibacter sp. SGAir0037]
MNLLRLEFLKVLPYRTFWIILGAFAVLIFLFMYSSQGITINTSKLGDRLYQFPELWNNLTYVASYFNVIPGILMIILISDEYSFRTMRQQVIDGLSRLELVLAKFYMALVIAAACTLFLLMLGLFFGLMYSRDTSASGIFGQIQYLLYYFFQVTGFMSLAMLFSFIIKRSGLSIIVFIATTLVVEPIIRSQVPDHVDKYFPMKSLSSLTPLPIQQMVDQATSPSDILSPAVALVPAIIYTILFLLLSYMVLKLRDL